MVGLAEVLTAPAVVGLGRRPWSLPLPRPAPPVSRNESGLPVASLDASQCEFQLLCGVCHKVTIWQAFVGMWAFIPSPHLVSNFAQATARDFAPPLPVKQDSRVVAIPTSQFYECREAAAKSGHELDSGIANLSLEAAHSDKASPPW